jgi:hypothetical protein
MIEYYSNRRSYIQTSRTPSRYTSTEYGMSVNVNNKDKHKKSSRSQTGSAFSHPVDLIEEPPDKDGEFRPGIDRIEAEGVKQIYLAKQAKLKFLQASGILIETETVKREWKDIALRVQKTMLSIPDRVSEIFASMNDAEKIHNELTAEIRHALSSLQYRVKLDDLQDDDLNEEIEEKGPNPDKAEKPDSTL